MPGNVRSKHVLQSCTVATVKFTTGIDSDGDAGAALLAACVSARGGTASLA